MSMLSLLSLLVVFTATASQVCRDDIFSCSTCLQSSPMCVWCNDLNFTGSNCFERAALNDTNHTISCDVIVDLRSELEEINIDNPDAMDNMTVGSGGFNINETETLINPDVVFLRTRPNEPHTFDVEITIPQDYPLDFYYLMDLSFSMENDLEQIQNITPQIIATLRNLTMNFRVGFGGFSDKEALPFTYERQTDEFCILRGTCLYSHTHPPFNYIHYQSLTDDEQEFTESISTLNVAGNRDSPESTFDALMQAAVCTDIIGWRPTASHIVLIATDAPYHIAGDGKLVGALLPNDMKCHMSRDHTDGTYSYDKSLELDYPSLGQINYALDRQRIVPIFALINPNRFPYDTVLHYQDLTKQLQLNSYIGNLADGSSNILELIRDGYNSLAQSVSLSVPSVSGVEISVRPLCDETVGDACVNVSIGETASFEVSVEITDCDAVQDVQNITLEYQFLAISVTLELTALCQCDCDNENDRMRNSSVCRYQGDLVCGRCQCIGAFGRTCECVLPEGADPNAQGTGHDQCPVANGSLCNYPHGNCYCNECECEADYEGDACEQPCTCDDGCGGPLQGECVCTRGVLGQPRCMCNEGFTGDNCNCSLSTTNCTDNQGTECSDNGNCVCGMCECTSDCRGTLCERCPDQLLQCNNHRECVQCRLSNLGEANVRRPADCNNACQVDTIFIDPLNSSQSNSHTINGNPTRRCSFTDDGNCFYTFYAAVDADYFLQPLDIERRLRCASSTSDDNNNLIWIIPLAIVVGLLVLGLIILLIIKLFLLILDYVEVRQFERAVRDAEGKLAQTSQPLYQSPVVEYQNLAYGIEKKDNK